MIDGQKVIAFTPCGRKRYMDLLAAHVARDVARGLIDKWILFNNAYSIEDSTYAQQLADHYPWIEVFNQNKPGIPERIADFFKFMYEGEGVVYFRLDDDVVWIDENCVERLVRYRLANPHPFLVFPTIINNVRTSYHLQQNGNVPMEWGEIENEMCDHVAHRWSHYVHNLHLKALSAIEKGTLVQEFTLPSEQFSDKSFGGDPWKAGNISINSFAIMGKDMLECTVHPDEEGYLSLWRPKELERPNARCGNACLIHFAYHTQTQFMDSTGMLNDYLKIAPPLGIRTVRLTPDKPKPAEPVASRKTALDVRNERMHAANRGRPVAPPVNVQPPRVAAQHEQHRILQRQGLKA